MDTFPISRAWDWFGDHEASAGVKLAPGTADRAYPRFPDPPWGGCQREYWENVDMGGGGFKGFSSKKRASTATFWSQVYNAYYSFLFAQILVLDFVQLKLKKVVYIPLG